MQIAPAQSFASLNCVWLENRVRRGRVILVMLELEGFAAGFDKAGTVPNF
jgi:hypothetical protein